MSNATIIKAWKNPEYRLSLNEVERAALPANPAGTIMVSDEDLGKASGSMQAFLTSPYTRCLCTIIECPHTLRPGCSGRL